MQKAIRELFNLVFTLIAVSVFCFVFYQLAPIDRTELILQKRGISPLEETDQETYNKIYFQVENELGLNLPLFYLTFRPSYVPNPWKKNMDNKARLSLQLFRNKYKETYVSEYCSILDTLEQNTQLSEVKNLVSFLWTAANPDLINQYLESLSGLSLPLMERKKVNRLIVLHSQMQADLVHFYYPKVSWHGKQNQYHLWVSSLYQDGIYLKTSEGRPIGASIGRSLSWTMTMVIISLGIMVVFGVLLGIMLHSFQHRWWSKMISIMLNGFYAIPIFWLATLMIVFFTSKDYGAWTDIFPSPMATIAQEDSSVILQAWNNLSQLFLPIICMVLVSLPVIVRVMVHSLSEEFAKPYATALQAKGLSKRQIYYHHILPNAILPLVTLIGNYLPAALAGSLLIEVIFNIPGMGRLIFDGIYQGEIELVFVILMIISIVTTVVLFFSDLLYKWLNPKIEIF